MVKISPAVLDAADDLSAAVRALAPKVSSETAAPEAIGALPAGHREAERAEHSVFQPSLFTVHLEHARKVLAENPDDAALREAIDSLTP